MTPDQDAKSAARVQPSGQLRLEQVSKRFDRVEAVCGVDLQVEAGTILSLLGPSGCGKTTILRMVAGFLRPSSGRVFIDDVDVTDTPANLRNLGMVFQSYALFPHKTVAENVAFGLMMRRVPAQEARKKVREALQVVRMAGMEDRFPAQLSGGQQQRVSLARAIIIRPRILLLDEPFGALDRLMRESMQIEVKELQRQLGITFLFVTHDQEEALTLSDRIAVLNGGRIQQVGTPSDVFERPASLFVAQFFGSLNEIKAKVIGRSGADHVVETQYGRWSIPSEKVLDGPCVLAVRARDVAILERASDRAIAARGRIRDVIYKGNTTMVQVALERGDLISVVLDHHHSRISRPGEAVFVGWPADKARLYPLSEAGENGPSHIR